MVYPVFCFLLFTCSQKCGLPCFLLPFLYFSFFLLTSTKNMFFFAYYVFFIIKKIKHGLARFLFFPPCLHSKILLVLFFSFSFLLLFFLALKNVACPTFSLSSFYAKNTAFPYLILLSFTNARWLSLFYLFTVCLVSRIHSLHLCI